MGTPFLSAVIIPKRASSRHATILAPASTRDKGRQRAAPAASDLRRLRASDASGPDAGELDTVTAHEHGGNGGETQMRDAPGLGPCMTTLAYAEGAIRGSLSRPARSLPHGALGVSSRTVADSVAGASLEGLACPCMPTRQTVENTTPFKLKSTRLNPRAILWQQRVGAFESLRPDHSLRRLPTGPNPTNPRTCVNEKFCMGIKLAVHHSLPVNVHRRRHIYVPHQLLLNSDRSTCCIEPAAEGVAGTCASRALVLRK
jgi:hypothetical protein